MQWEALDQVTRVLDLAVRAIDMAVRLLIYFLVGSILALLLLIAAGKAEAAPPVEFKVVANRAETATQRTEFKVVENRCEVRSVPAGPVPNATHSCPTCGHQQLLVYSVRPDGTHTHRCFDCGTEWYHPQSQPQGVGSSLPYALPFASYGGCPNGNCPTPIPTSGGRVFRR